MKKVMILGSTGSVGTKALDVAEHLGYEITAISANTNIKLLENKLKKAIRLLSPVRMIPRQGNLNSA